MLIRKGMDLSENERISNITIRHKVLSGEPENTNFIVFGLTRQGLDLRIYGTRGDHDNRVSSNYYTVDNIYYYA
jgi:hypothetical protein